MVSFIIETKRRSLNIILVVDMVLKCLIIMKKKVLCHILKSLMKF